MPSITAPPPPSGPTGPGSGPVGGFAALVAGVDATDVTDGAKRVVSAVRDAHMVVNHLNGRMVELVRGLFELYRDELVAAEFDITPDSAWQHHDRGEDEHTDAVRPTGVDLDEVAVEHPEVLAEAERSAARMVSAEIAAGLGWSPSQARSAVRRWLSWAVCEPVITNAMTRGELELDKAGVIAAAVGVLGDRDERDRVAAAVVAEAPGLSTRQLGERADALVTQIDPNAAQARHERQLEVRRLVIDRGIECTADLRAVGVPADKAVAAFNRIDALARRAKQAGDPRALDNLRCDLAIELLTGTARFQLVDPGGLDPNPDGQPITQPTTQATAPTTQPTARPAAPTNPPSTGPTMQATVPTAARTEPTTPRGQQDRRAGDIKPAASAGTAGTAHPAGSAASPGTAGWAGTAGSAASPGWAGTAESAASPGTAGTAHPAGSAASPGTAGATGCDCVPGGGCVCECGTAYANPTELTDLELAFAALDRGSAGRDAIERVGPDQPTGQTNAGDHTDTDHTDTGHTTTGHTTTGHTDIPTTEAARGPAAPTMQTGAAASEPGVFPIVPIAPGENPGRSKALPDTILTVPLQTVLSWAIDPTDATTPAERGSGTPAPATSQRIDPASGQSSQPPSAPSSDRSGAPSSQPLAGGAPAWMERVGPLLDSIARRVMTARLAQAEQNGSGEFRLAVTDKQGRVVQYHALHTRTLRGLLREAVAVDQGTCVFSTCNRPALRCQADHAVPYARVRVTRLGNMEPLCGADHRVKTVGGYGVEKANPHDPASPATWRLIMRSGHRYPLRADPASPAGLATIARLAERLAQPRQDQRGQRCACCGCPCGTCGCHAYADHPRYATVQGCPACEDENELCTCGRFRTKYPSARRGRLPAAPAAPNQVPPF